MKHTLTIRAGDHFFCTHPLSGALLVGALMQELLDHGYDGTPSPRISPVMQPPATRQHPAATSPAVVPVSSTTTNGIGSHLWVG